MPAQWMSTTRTAALGKMAAPPGLAFNGQTHQTLKGFGGCFNELGWEALSSLQVELREEALRSLFDAHDGCGFTFCRVPIGASDYAVDWYSLNDTPGDLDMACFSLDRDRQRLIPYIKSAMRYQPGLEVFASPWSPPAWMKRPAVYNYGHLRNEPDVLRAYASYFVKFVQGYRAEGIDVSQIHPQNEVVADQKFPSCVWSGEQLRDFIRDYLGPAFEAAGLDCEIWLGTINSDDYNAWANLVLSDPGARRFIKGVGYQWAGKGAIQRTHQAWPEMALLQTENECGEGRNTWEYAHYVFNLLQHYFSNGVVGYVYWNMLLGPGGASTWGWSQNAMITCGPISADLEYGRLTYNPEFYVMKHAAHFVKPGAVRLGLAGPWTSNALAFRNPDGSQVVIIANPFQQERIFSFNGAFMAPLSAESFNTFVLP